MNAPLPCLLTESQYRSRRSVLLHRVLAQKQRLRTRITPYLSVLFETETTVMWQIYEQMRVEGPWTRQRGETLLAEYSVLLPTPGTRTATVFVDGPPDPGMTRALATTPGTLSIHDRQRCWPGRPIGTPNPDGSVHYLAFDLDVAPRTACLRAGLSGRRWTAALPDGICTQDRCLSELLAHSRSLERHRLC